jgi:hypothetical protein
MTIEEHLENMERELGCMKRRNRWLLGAILLIAGGLIVPGVFETTAVRARAQVAGKAKEIRANRILLDDENGKLRVGLAVFKNGPGLVLADEKGVGRFVAGKGIRVTPDGKTIALPESSVVLFGPDGKIIWNAIK